PELLGARVQLRPVAPHDHQWLYENAVATGAGHRWRLHGLVPGPDAFLAGFYDGAAASLMVERRDPLESIGVIQLWNLDQLSRTGQLNVFIADDFQGLGWPMEGLVLATRFVFEAYDLRKLYAEVLQPQMANFESLVGWALEREGLLRAHRYVMGDLVDCHVLAIYRDRYEELSEGWSTIR
ncbi:hypothetical protein B7486_54265, partial [cyanobacterium TDX16]